MSMRRSGFTDEDDRMAKLLMAEFERAEHRPVTASWVATFADMARAVRLDRESREPRMTAGEGLRALAQRVVDQGFLLHDEACERGDGGAYDCTCLAGRFATALLADPAPVADGCCQACGGNGCPECYATGCDPSLPVHPAPVADEGQVAGLSDREALAEIIAGIDGGRLADASTRAHDACLRAADAVLASDWLAARGATRDGAL